MGGEGSGRRPSAGVLTPRERRVLEELHVGGTNAELAIRLGLSPETVKFHISNMLAKSGLTDRHDLAAWDETRGDNEQPRSRSIGFAIALATAGALAGAVGLALTFAVSPESSRSAAQSVADCALEAAIAHGPVDPGRRLEDSFLAHYRRELNELGAAPEQRAAFDDEFISFEEYTCAGRRAESCLLATGIARISVEPAAFAANRYLWNVLIADTPGPADGAEVERAFAARNACMAAHVREIESAWQGQHEPLAQQVEEAKAAFAICLAAEEQQAAAEAAAAGGAQRIDIAAPTDDAGGFPLGSGLRPPGRAESICASRVADELDVSAAMLDSY